MVSRDSTNDTNLEYVARLESDLDESGQSSKRSNLIPQKPVRKKVFGCKEICFEEIDC